MASPLWQRIRRIWITVGLVTTAVFITWTLVAFRAAPEAHAALQTDAAVTILSSEHAWTFQPALGAPRPRHAASLLLLPGAMVDPVAYAPLARRVAEAGYPVVLLRLPWRGAFGRADGPDFLEQARAVMHQRPGPWVLSGHSRGAVVAARIALAGDPQLKGLVLLGTTHPRDFSLAHLSYYVAKVYGTADGVAPMSKVRANAALLPPTTHWVELAGGNHSQFGSYGFQPMDHRPTMERSEQQAQTAAALLAALNAAASP